MKVILCADVKGQGKKEIGLDSYLPSAYFDIWRKDKREKEN